MYDHVALDYSHPKTDEENKLSIKWKNPNLVIWSHFLLLQTGTFILSQLPQPTNYQTFHAEHCHILPSLWKAGSRSFPSVQLQWCGWGILRSDTNIYDLCTIYIYEWVVNSLEIMASCVAGNSFVKWPNISGNSNHLWAVVQREFIFTRILREDGHFTIRWVETTN